MGTKFQLHRMKSCRDLLHSTVPRLSSTALCLLLSHKLSLAALPIHFSKDIILEHTISSMHISKVLRFCDLPPHYHHSSHVFFPWVSQFSFQRWDGKYLHVFCAIPSISTHLIETTIQKKRTHNSTSKPFGIYTKPRNVSDLILQTSPSLSSTQITKKLAKMPKS